MLAYKRAAFEQNVGGELGLKHFVFICKKDNEQNYVWDDMTPTCIPLPLPLLQARDNTLYVLHEGRNIFTDSIVAYRAVSRQRWQESVCSNRGTVANGVFYRSPCREVDN